MCNRKWWVKTCGSRTDVVERNCVVTQVGSENPLAFHCIIHDEVICCHISSSNNGIDNVSTVDNIRRKGLTHLQFQDLLEKNLNTL
jgi:hypothetical protein